MAIVKTVKRDYIYLNPLVDAAMRQRAKVDRGLQRDAPASRLENEVTARVQRDERNRLRVSGFKGATPALHRVRKRNERPIRPSKHHNSELQ
jgi:hypothetical protein